MDTRPPFIDPAFKWRKTWPGNEATKHLNKVAENDAQLYAKEQGAQPTGGARLYHKNKHNNNLLTCELLQACLCDLMSPHLSCE